MGTRVHALDYGVLCLYSAMNGDCYGTVIHEHVS